MASIDHHCGECDLMWADNEYASLCPKCGSDAVSNLSDEYDFDPWEEYYEEYEEEVWDERE